VFFYNGVLFVIAKSNLSGTIIMTAHTEKERLQIVRQFSELDFSNNQELKDIVKLATKIYQAPIALITLMGEDQQLIKIKAGTNVESNSREDSFCKYLVGAKEVLVVPDATKDERFRNNPAVRGACNVRFYAGAPLISASGDHLGSLCVFDHKVHEFSEDQKEMLAILSKQVVKLLELKMSLGIIETQNEKVASSETKLRAFFNSSTSCHVLISTDLEILDFNKATFQFIKEIKGMQIQNGTSILDYIREDNRPEFIRSFNEVLTGKPTKKDILINHAEGKVLWWNLSFLPVKDNNGNIISVSYTATNINESKMQMQAICAQNESLKNIAHIQSHEYRRPVASIIGIMDIIKGENYKPDKESLLMMEAAVGELDEKIKGVIKCSEKVLSDNYLYSELQDTC